MSDARDRALQDAERRADVQYAVSRVLSDATSVRQAFASLLSALAHALDWDYGGVWLVAGDELVCAETWANDDPSVLQFAQTSRATVFPRGRGLPGRCWVQSQAVWFAAINRDLTIPRAQQAIAAQLQGALAFPAVSSSGVVAVVEGFTKGTEQISPQLLQLFDAIGRQLGQFLHRRAAEERVQQDEARYRAIVDGALDAIVAIDANGLVTEFNRAAERMFGYTRAEILGREMASLIVPERFRATHRAGLARLATSGEPRALQRRLELAAIRRDGTEFPIELTITRFGGADRGAFVGFLRDITERQRHAEEREALMRNERAAYREAAEANRLKDEFLAALSHELRTPLNAISGWTHLLEQGRLEPDKVPRAYGIIRRNAEIQLQLVTDMLDLSAFIAGRVRLSFEPCRLLDPIEAAVDTILPAAASKRLALNVAVPDVTITGDQRRLQQVFWNLVGNAVKFTPAGGAITVLGKAQDDAVTVEVRDTGIGISPDFLPVAFDRFRQGMPPGQGGLGLGLAIVRQIVEAHGGTVRADSAGLGAGAVFTVTLPQGPATARV